MPENAEVYIMAEQLNELLQGKYLHRISINNRSRHHRLKITGIDNIINFKKSELIKVYSKGKLLIFEYDHFWITCNLGFGIWSLEKAKHTGICFHYSSYIFTFYNYVPVYFDDERHYGKINIYYNYFELNKKLEKIGVDILQDVLINGDDIGKDLYDNWFLSFKNKRLKNREVCKHLLEQKYFSGIGNYLKSEILYESRIHPGRKLEFITDEEILTMLINARKIVLKAYHSNGLTIQKYVDINGDNGKYDIKAYKKVGINEYGHEIIRTEFSDKRGTYWCPDIQL
jgi:endonuclease-8